MIEIVWNERRSTREEEDEAKSLSNQLVRLRLPLLAFFLFVTFEWLEKEGRKMSNESNEDDYQISLEGLANRIVGKSFRTHRHEPGQREAIGKVNVLQAER